MPANFRPEMSVIKDLKPFRFWCSKVLPSVYDDSLSYYELLTKVISYLNSTMESVEALDTNVNNLYNAYVLLEGYVNNYFDNTDFQQMVNDKLDSMAEDGTLTALIKNYVDPMFDDLTDDVLTEFENQNQRIGNAINTQNTKLGVIESQMNEFIADHAGPAMAFTLWSGYADAVGTNITLSDDPSNYDYIEVYFRTVGSSYCPSIHRFPADSFHSTPNLSVVQTEIGNNSNDTRLHEYRINIEPTDSVDATKYRIRYSNHWLWAGTVDSDAINYENTISDEQQASAGIVKIVGIKNVQNNAEVIDARIGGNGVTYTTLGEAIRAQYNLVNADIQNIETIFETSGVDKYVPTSGVFIAGRSLISNGETTENLNRSVTNYIYCPKGSYIAVNEGYRFNVGEYSGLTASTLFKYSTFQEGKYFIENDCYVRFTVASVDDSSVVDASTASSNFNGFIISSHVKTKSETETTIVNLSNSNIEYGSINTSGENISASNRVRTAETVFLKKRTVVTNKNNVTLAWRRYTDAEATQYEAASNDFSTEDFVINVDGYYRFVIAQNNWSNGNLSMIISISNNTIDKYGAEIDALKEQIDPYVGFPILFPPNTAYKYTGSNIPLNIVNGDGDMLTTLYNWYDDLVARFPNHISKSVIGTDQSGEYEIRCYTISSYSTTVKPKILWISGIHASEKYTHTSTYMLVKELLENHENNEALNFIWSNCTLLVVPIANPWGLANGGDRYNSRGVNLNRNFDADWTYDGSQYGNSGSEPQSESETQAIVDFINDNSDAVFAITKHDSDTFASQSYRLGYDVSSFSVDRMVFRSLWARMDAEIKKDYDWIVNNYPTTETFNLFRNNATSDNKGTMDKWFNMEGMHGGLFEVSRPGNNDITASHKEDFVKIGLETSVNIVASAIQHNQLILKSNRLTYRYKQILDE